MGLSTEKLFIESEATIYPPVSMTDVDFLKVSRLGQKELFRKGKCRYVSEIERVFSETIFDKRCRYTQGDFKHESWVL